MDLKQLAYFVRVAELGSFTKAAQALGVAQPALSRQVRLLEVELRQSLLTRNGRGAAPTEAGRRLLEHGRGILHQVERALEDMGQSRDALVGRVTMGLPPSLARVLTVAYTRAFRQAMPQAQLSITEGLSSGLIEGVQQGRLDVAVVYETASTSDLDLQPLMDDALVLVQARPAGLALDPPPTPLPLSALKGLPLVIPSRPNAIRMHVEAQLGARGLRPEVALEIDGVQAILDLVAEGVGAALLPPYAVARSLRPSAYLVTPLAPPGLRIPVSVAISRTRPATRTQQAALALLLQVAPAVART